MSRIIKRTETSTPDTPTTSAPSSDRKRGILDKDTYAARADAADIRGRAEKKSKEIIALAKQEAQKTQQKAAAEAVETNAQAQQKAEQIIANAQEELEQRRADAKTEGYETGRQEGAAELTETIAQASQRFQLIETEVVPQLHKLALGIAKKIIGRELEFQPEAIVDIVKHALAEKARQRREIALRVNPADLELLKSNREDMLEVLSRAKEISIREDPNVALGGCVIETDAGVIDAQLDTQLEIFERVLQKTKNS